MPNIARLNDSIAIVRMQLWHFPFLEISALCGLSALGWDFLPGGTSEDPSLGPVPSDF